MAKVKTLTTANSVFALSIAGIYDTPQTLKGYAADDAFSAGEVTPGEALMGVDGIMSYGYTPYPIEMNISLQADSPSIAIFDNWIKTQNQVREAYAANAEIVLPSTGAKYTLTKGVLTKGKPLPDAKKVLQPVSYTITWESITPSEV